MKKNWSDLVLGLVLATLVGGWFYSLITDSLQQREGEQRHLRIERMLLQLTTSQRPFHTVDGEDWQVEPRIPTTNLPTTGVDRAPHADQGK